MEWCELAIIGSGMNNAVYALASYNGYLVAGWRVSFAGGAAIGYIAQWNGSSWLPAGIGIGGVVFALSTINGKLFAEASSALVSGHTYPSGTAHLGSAGWRKRCG